MLWHSLVLDKIRHARVSRLAGFGLVELMVAISVMTIVLSIILARQSAFNSAILLRNQAYDIALAIREVQLSAVSAVTAEGTGNDFRNKFGLYFNATAGANGGYQIFRDKPTGSNDNYFFDSEDEEYGGLSQLDSRFEIREIRVNSFAKDDVSIIFERPNFDAVIATAPNGVLTDATVEIDIAKRDGGTDVRTIEVTSTGQIAVQ